MTRIAQMAKVEKHGNKWIVKVAGPHGWIVGGEWNTKREAEADAKTYRKNPMRKKKRSAKQLANDRRLGRMAKARAKVKRGGRSRVTRKVTRKKVARKKTKRNPHKKVAKRTVLKKSHLWSIFKCYGKSVRFFGLTTAGKLQWTIRDAAIIWKSKDRAAKIAKKVSTKRGMANYHVGVASRETTSAQIVAACSK